MTFSGLMVIPLTIVNPGSGTDRNNNSVPDWTDASRTAVNGWLEQSQSSEVLTDRDAQVSLWSLFVPADTPITGYSRVETGDGTVYEVDGPPKPAHTKRGVHHIEARLRLVVG